MILSWGSNSHGQLGLGTFSEQELLPTEISISIKAKDIVGGGKHTVLLTNDNEVYTCGDNDKGQLGKDLAVGSVNIFQSINCPIKISKITCGWDFNLALTENYEVFGWGSNSFGQLGMPVKKVLHLSAPLKIFEKKAIALSAGLRHSAIVSSDGLLYTCGYGRKGQLGFCLNLNVPVLVDSFTQVQCIKDCEAIACGECHCVTKTENGKFYSWGNNKHGQLGIDPKIISVANSPQEFDLPLQANKVNNLLSGWAHNLVLTDNGCIISWGRNDFGQLGEERKHSWKPQCVKNIGEVEQIKTGSHHSVILTKSNKIITWGWNEHGNCGNGSYHNVKVPYEFPEFVGNNRIKVVGSGAAHSFLCFSDGQIWSFSDKMQNFKTTEILEIKSSNLEPINSNEDLAEINVIDISLDYSDFFESYLLTNKPCIIKDICKDWPCITNWIKDKTLDVEYFKTKFSNKEVPISNCRRRDFNVQKKCSMKLFDYLDYWEECKKSQSLVDCLYLKDWHFMKNFPKEEVYRVPIYFASDWLNEYYDNNTHLNDDYRFVYIGPKGSWTPFHADVFTSYSWSVNICGRKKWILIPPGKEDHFRDDLGNLQYDIDLSKVSSRELKDKFPVFEVIQEEGWGLFVPSGWHHQVWNLEDTISINHNWINGCNVRHVWESLKRNLEDVMKEISDCKEMENWLSQCQLVLSASFGFNYQSFYNFLVETAKRRIKALKLNENILVYGNWSLGENHMKFDLKQLLPVLRSMERDESFLEISKIDEGFNHWLEFLDSLNNFIDSDL